MPLIIDKATIDAFAQELGESIAARYPPQIDNDLKKKPSEARLTSIVEDACARASTFRADKGLGWLGKARLGNAVRWQLTERGYSKAFVDLTTEAVVVKISR